MDVDDDYPRELHLLPSPFSSATSWHRYDEPSSLDLQLSIRLPPQDCHLDVAALKWQANELIRLSAIEKAYTEHVRELTRREVEMAQTEFTRARHIRERAREDMERAKRMKDRAIRQGDSSSSSCCVEITCQSCRQRFRP